MFTVFVKITLKSLYTQKSCNITMNNQIKEFQNKDLGQYTLNGYIYNAVQIAENEVRLWSHQIQDSFFVNLKHFNRCVEQELLERVEN